MIPANQRPRSKIQVLAVDNNPVLLHAITRILTQEGCEVVKAETGLDALEILDHTVPDIIFTDLIMPRVSGELLCRMVRSSERFKDVFIVVLSAIVIEDKQRILEEVDCDLCIAKGNLKELRKQARFALDAFESRVELSGDAVPVPQIPSGLKPSEVATELLLEKQHILEILSNLSEGILELTNDGKIIVANRSACEILLSEEEKLISRKLHETGVWGEFEPAVKRWVNVELQGGGQPYHIYEDTPLVIGGRTITASFVPVKESETLFGLCILRDITRQYKAEKHYKQLDDALKFARKMDAMSCMAGGMAHDFNNLLTVICGNLDIISMQSSRTARNSTTKLIKQAQKAALIAVDLTRQISCFSNFGIASRKDKSLSVTAQETTKDYFERSGGEYSIECTGVDIIVRMDSEEISSAIVKVLQNAQEASGQKRVDIVVSTVKLASPEIIAGQYIPAGNFGCVEITDSGSGIDKDELFKVFDPYYSTKVRGIEKGMGLGLTIVYATFRNHGGYVVVDSKKNEGTKVSLYLPVVSPLDGLMIGDTPQKTEVAVLVVDPDPQMREIGSIMLSHLGFEVQSFKNSTEASDTLQKMKNDDSRRKAIVLLDVSGVKKAVTADYCKVFKKIDPEVHVIAMSGTILDPLMEKCQEYGFANSLSKPYTMDGLRHVVDSVLYS